MSARSFLPLCSFALAALIGCGSTVIVAPPGADSGATPTDTGSTPVDTGTPTSDRVTPVVDVPAIRDVGVDGGGVACRLSNGVLCPAGQACSDGCNTCFCPTDGGPVACTTRACVDAGPPGGCRSRADCSPEEECTFRERGCGMTGVCAAITDCAAIRPYCACDGTTFLDCPGSPHQQWVREGECGTAVDAGVPMDSAVCAGASIGPTGGYCAGPTDRPLPMECCTGWNCDTRNVMCFGMPTPCPAGQVNLVAMGCWGACVPADRCASMRCLGTSCPRGFTCNDVDTCVPVKID